MVMNYQQLTKAAIHSMDSILASPVFKAQEKSWICFGIWRMWYQATNAMIEHTESDEDHLLNHYRDRTAPEVTSENQAA